MFTEIDPRTWPGEAMYRQFSAMGIPYFSVTTTVDVTALVHLGKERDLSFFSLCLYGIVHGLNATEAFRYRVLPDGRVILHHTVETMYILLRADKTITAVSAPLLPDFDEFRLEQRRREELAAHAPPNFYAGEDRKVAFFSSVPWLAFTSLTHPCQIGAKYDSIPRLTIGRYTRHPDGRITMPLDLHMHHGFVDGYQIHALLTNVQALWDGLRQKEYGNHSAQNG